jgi:hypothetical protein
MNEITLTSPVLLDKGAREIATVLEARLSWLNAYGKAERRIEQVEGEIFSFPAIATGEHEYLRMMPDSTLGCFSFFDFVDPAVIDRQSKSYVRASAICGVVFWGDLRTVYPGQAATRTVENVKRDVLAVLEQYSTPKTRFEVQSIAERAENIYPGYTAREINNQYLMRPHFGFRVNGLLTVAQSC